MPVVDVDVLKQVPEGWKAIQWWGISILDWIFIQATNISSQYNSQCYHPAWGSLAWDYLVIMSSSVPGEHAFSQGGITISKQCSHLKGDIVEALQCINCVIWHDLLFWELAPSLILEAEETSNQELDNAGARGDLGDLEESDVEEFSWDGLLIEDEDEETMYWSE